MRDLLAALEASKHSLDFDNLLLLLIGKFEVGVEVWNLILGRHRIIAAALISHLIN